MQWFLQPEAHCAYACVGTVLMASGMVRDITVTAAATTFGSAPRAAHWLARLFDMLDRNEAALYRGGPNMN